MAVAKGLATTHCVLLVGVGETNISPHLYVIQRVFSGWSPLDGSTAEGGVPEAEGLASTLVGGWGGEGTLARPAEEVESDGGEVSNGLQLVLVGVLLEVSGEGLQDGDVDWTDPGGSWVIICPDLEKGAEQKGVPWPV
jgi:hypothetical protein